ncbi:MAG: NAD-dependent malic enzyme [Clostridiales bacterium]|nr:NAD-dependent malic enzyme [Clostridiales bacterium]
MDLRERALLAHENWQGKIEVISRAKLEDKDDLTLCYTPGVAEPCKEIAKEEELVYKYTRKGNLVAVVTDGTAVLGLGDIGPKAGMPVMEGKACLFKAFADVDAVPICLDTKDVDEIVKTVINIAPTFGGINLEDIAAPRCFEVEKRLIEALDIPVFHDDQHGTAVVVLAALTNALKLAGKAISSIKIVINGAGAAGTAICRLLLSAGAKNVVMVDRFGALVRGDEKLNPAMADLASVTNPDLLSGPLAEVIKGADVFIGVSAPNVLKGDMIKTMADKPIIFAMANPMPEIMPEEAKAAGAFIVGTGRSDYPNQINNVLCFPGIFRGALDVRAKVINHEMKLAAAKAIADMVGENELSPDKIMPPALDKRISMYVAKAVAEAAIRTGATK